MNFVLAYENVTVYVFTGRGCKHCNEAVNYLYNHIEKYSDIVDIVTYEVWHNEANSKLYNDIKNSSGLDIRAIPCIIIGDHYVLNGFTSKEGQIILNEAYKQSRSEEYHDLVKTYLSNHADAKSQTMEELLVSEGVLKKTAIGDYIILGFFVVVLIGSGALIFGKSPFKTHKKKHRWEKLYKDVNIEKNFALKT